MRTLYADVDTLRADPATPYGHHPVAARTTNTPDTTSGHTGFRCARSV
ncbi:hypothetical protein [Streptomyces sp. NPDC058855]